MEPGTLIGRFVVEKPLGEGGMGVVYAGRDPHLDRRVAIKVLRGERGGFGDRLLREAQALAQLSHPNVVGVYEVGVHAEQVFVAMELVDGQGLDRLMSAGAMPWRRALELLVQAGRGLVAAHKKGIVHRDFKPSNVMVDGEGRVRVADFGLARLAAADASDHGTSPARDERPSTLATTVDSGRDDAAHDDAHAWTPSSGGARLLGALLTRDGAVLGTPRYMAPEQHAGKTATEAWDQYSFCLVLWEAMFGALPFAGADVETLAASKAAGRIVHPDDAPRIPGWLIRAVERGLSPDPARRHASMASLVAALEETPVRRRRAALAGVAAVGVAAAAIGGFALASRDERRVGCDRADAALALTWSPEARAGVIRVLGDAGEPVAAAIDTRVGAWRGARVDACRATHDRREQSAALLDRRAGCFERQRLELETLVAAIARGDTPGWLALEAARDLPDAARCGAAALAGTPPAVTGARADETTRLVADATTANRLGRSDEARRLGVEAVTAAREVGDPLLLAEALAVQAKAAGEYDHVQRRAILEEALGVASEAGAPSLEASLATELLDQATAERVPERIRTLLPIAAAALRRAGVAADAAVRAEAKLDEAHALSILGRRDEAARACEELGALVPDKMPHCRCYISLELDVESARAACEEAVALAERSWGPDHPEVAGALVSLSSTVRNQGDYKLAVTLAKRALAIDERTRGETSNRVQRDLGAIINALVDGMRPREAQTTITRALALLERNPGRTDGVRARLLSQRAEVNVMLDDADAGYRDAVDALAAATRHYGAEQHNIPYYHYRIAQTLKMGKDDCAGAVTSFQKVIELSKRTIGETSEMYLLGLQGAAECLVRLERATEARPLFEEAMRIAPALELQPYNRAMLFAAYGECLSVLGDRAGAIREFGKARELLVALPEARGMVEQVDAFVKQL
jgi:tetratricopeptide (TPR) repeat protein